MMTILAFLGWIAAFVFAASAHARIDIPRS
jgi:hypothetical protein